MTNKKAQPLRVLKRYAGSRIYDHKRQFYFSAEELETLKVQGVRLTVRDVETGQDVTHEILPSSLH